MRVVRRRISRFEWRILIAVFLSGVAPFIISLVFIPIIVESHYALSVHRDVVAQLESSVGMYKEFLEAKKREFSARAASIARDPVLIRALAEDDQEATRARLEQVLADNHDLRSVKLYRPDGTVMLEQVEKRERNNDEYAGKSFRFPVGLGEQAIRVEAEFLLPARHLSDQRRAAEVATLYGTAVQVGDTLERENLATYIGITSLVLLFALAAGFMLARQVTRRVAELASATERVSRGDLEFELPSRGSDEIAELTGAFNKMIAELNEAQNKIVYLEKISGWQEFARRLAHEIKNPLTPIQLAIQELRLRTPDTDPKFKALVEDSASMVEEEIAALTRLVDEFSQFARLPEVMTEEVDLVSFLDDVLSAYNYFEAEAKVDVESPEEPIQVDLDRVLMRRVVANLAENAIQAAGDGAQLTVVCRAKGENRVELRFEDNGPGVEADQRARIFDPYFTTKSEGTGLGLAIVKKIVLQHGGSIALCDSRHGGAGFSIVLPRHPA